MTRDAAITAARAESDRRHLPFLLTMHGGTNDWTYRILDGTPVEDITYSEADAARRKL